MRTLFVLVPFHIIHFWLIKIANFIIHLRISLENFGSVLITLLLLLKDLLEITTFSCSQSNDQQRNFYRWIQWKNDKHFKSFNHFRCTKILNVKNSFHSAIDWCPHKCLLFFVSLSFKCIEHKKQCINWNIPNKITCPYFFIKISISFYNFSLLFFGKKRKGYSREW